MCRSLWVSPLVALHWLTYIPMQTIKPTPAFLFFLKQREQVPIHWFNFPVPETTRARNWTRQALHLGCRLTDCSIEGSKKWAGLLPLLPHYSAVIWVTINICSVTFLPLTTLASLQIAFHRLLSELSRFPQLMSPHVSAVPLLQWILSHICDTFQKQIMEKQTASSCFYFCSRSNLLPDSIHTHTKNFSVYEVLVFFFSIFLACQNSY